MRSLHTAFLLSSMLIRPLQSTAVEMVPYQVHLLSETPRVSYVEHFLTSEECDYLIERAKPKLTRSEVVDNENKGNKLDEARTSLGVFLYPKGNDDPLMTINKRIHELTQMPEANGESLHVLFYGIGKEYRPHYDYFNPLVPGGAECLSRGGQRYVTVILYLNDTEEGGETVFPLVNLKIKPVKGNALLFYNCLPSGAEDPLTLHGGLPVIKGEKWIATKWIRMQAFR